MYNQKNQIVMTSLNNHSELAYCTGADHYVRHSLAPVLFTSGVIHAVEHAKAYWLLDVIASYYDILKKVHKSQEHFTIRLTKSCFKLNKTTGEYEIKENDKNPSSYDFYIEDGNYNILIHQNIPFSDFEYDTFMLYLVGDVCLLPSEY